MPASVYNTDTTVMDAALGIGARFTVEDFEDSSFEPGFSISYAAANAGGDDILTNGTFVWDGENSLRISAGRRAGFNAGPTFSFDQGIAVFGIGIANLGEPGWTVSVNGTEEVSNLASIAGIDIDPSRNGYLLIRADAGEAINSVTIDKLDTGDVLLLDHMAFAAVPLPAPALMLITGLAALGVVSLRRA